MHCMSTLHRLAMCMLSTNKRTAGTLKRRSGNLTLRACLCVCVCVCVCVSYDNVGGETLEAALETCNRHARVVRHTHTHTHTHTVRAFPSKHCLGRHSRGRARGM